MTKGLTAGERRMIPGSGGNALDSELVVVLAGRTSIDAMLGSVEGSALTMTNRHREDK